MFIVDINKEHIAVAEARKLGIKIVAVVDTNTNPAHIDYPIPGNDDAIRAIELFASRIADAYLEGSGQLDKQLAEEQEASAAAEAEAEAAASEAVVAEAAASEAAPEAEAPQEEAAAGTEEDAAVETAASEEPAGEEADPASVAAEEGVENATS